jgi:GxxExxY protein
MTELLHRETSRCIVQAFHQVYAELGTGFLESVYAAALVHALRQQTIEVEREVPVTVYFRGCAVGVFRVDVLVERRVAVELKAARVIDPSHEAQLLNYLRATDLEVGLLLNFGRKAEVRRFAFSNERKLQARAKSLLSSS